MYKVVNFKVSIKFTFVEFLIETIIFCELERHGSTTKLTSKVTAMRLKYTLVVLSIYTSYLLFEEFD